MDNFLHIVMDLLKNITIHSSINLIIYNSVNYSKKIEYININ